MVVNSPLFSCLIMFFFFLHPRHVGILKKRGSYHAASFLTAVLDIDLLIASNNLNKIEKIRKEMEELFGERSNLHSYSKKEIIKKIKSDKFISNAFLNGVIVSGHDFGKELFISLKKRKDLARLFYFNERIKAALRNYANKDNDAAREILNRLLEQVIFYLLTEKGIPYVSKKDASKTIKKLPEGKIIQKIDKAPLKQKISLMENFILDILKNKVLEGEGHVE